MPGQQWKMREKIANNSYNKTEKFWSQYSASKGKMSTAYLKHLCSHFLNLCIHIFPHFDVICPFFSPKHVSNPKCDLLTSQFCHSLSFFLLLPAVALTPPCVFTAQKKPQLLLWQDMYSSIRNLYFPTHLKTTDLLSGL